MKFSKYNNPNKRRKAKKPLDPVTASKIVYDNMTYLEGTYGIKHTGGEWDARYQELIKEE